MKLLIEVSEDVKIINEAKEDGSKATYITGPYIVAETKNRNGRLYPSNIVENEVHRYINEYINKNRAVGELNHPPSPQINYERASHKILSLAREGNIWVGKSKIIEGAPMGKIVKALIDEGVAIGVSTRGVGSLKEDKTRGANIVGDDFRLCTVDIVSDPSGPGCFVQGIMEGAEWVFDAATDTWKQMQVEQLASETKSMSAKEVEARKVALFERFCQIMSTPESAVIAKNMFKNKR